MRMVDRADRQFDAYTFEEMHSNAGVWHEHWTSRPFDEVRLTDFLGGVSDVELVRSAPARGPAADVMVESVEAVDAQLRVEALDATLVSADRILDQVARAAPSGLSPRSLRLMRSQHSDLRAVIAGMGLLLLCFGAHLFSPSRRHR